MTDWDFHDKEIRTLVNGEVRQSGNTSEMEWDMHYLVADLARTITLLPGDVILSGTPAGSRPVEPGDVVTVEVEGLGALTNTIVEGEVPVRPEVGAQPSESEEVVSTALGGDWEFQRRQSTRWPGSPALQVGGGAMSPIVGITSWKEGWTPSTGRTTCRPCPPSTPTPWSKRRMTPLMFPSSLDPATAEGLVALVEGVVLSGGDDIDPLTYGEVNTASTKVSRASDQFEIAVVAAARRQGKPVLAICRGLQLVNVALGGTLEQEVTSAGGVPTT